MISMKCEYCRFFDNGPSGFDSGICKNEQVLNITGDWIAALINDARNICDREGDGHFVYFEPKYPQAGAAFVQTTLEQPTKPCSCLGICRGSEHLSPNYQCALKGTKPRTMTAAAGSPFSRRGAI